MEVLSLGICARTAHPQTRIFVSLQLSWKIFEGTCPPPKEGKTVSSCSSVASFNEKGKQFLKSAL